MFGIRSREDSNTGAIFRRQSPTESSKAATNTEYSVENGNALKVAIWVPTDQMNKNARPKENTETTNEISVLLKSLEMGLEFNFRSPLKCFSDLKTIHH